MTYREEGAEEFQIGEELVQRVILRIDGEKVAEILIGIGHVFVQLFQSSHIVIGTSDEVLQRESDVRYRCRRRDEAFTSIASVKRSPSMGSSSSLAMVNSSRALFNSRLIS